MDDAQKRDDSSPLESGPPRGNLHRTLLELTTRRSAWTADLDAALRAIAEASACALGTERVSIWFFNPDRTTISCRELFERDANRHSSGNELHRSEYPAYFRALESERTIAAHDAASDSRTSEFETSYLRPLGIRSMLDASIRHEGDLVGVVCHESVGELRRWTLEEEVFTGSIADHVAIAFGANLRRRTEESLRQKADLELLIMTMSGNFINYSPEEVDGGIQQALRQVGEFVDADRSYVVLASGDPATVTATYEWCREGIESNVSMMIGRPTSRFVWWSAQMRSGSIHLPDVDAVPAEAHAEREFLRMRGCRSVVAIPIMFRGSMLGFAGFDGVRSHTKWSQEVISLLKIVGGILASALERKRADSALRESETRYRIMAENSNDIISRLSPDGTFRYASPAIETLLGYSPESLIGTRPVDLFHPDDLRDPVAIRETLDRDRGRLTTRLRHANGTYIWFETTSRPVRHRGNGEIEEIIAVSRDISERKAAEEQIEHLAYHDALTELANRRLFRDRLDVALAHAHREKRTLAILFIDIDHFKIINDSLGHSIGDRLLQVLASRIVESLREIDTVARMGGDEFTVLLSEVAHEQDPARVAAKLLEAIANPVEIDGQTLPVTASIGIAIFPLDGADGETLLRNADMAMYRAKELGRSQYQLFTAAMNDRVMERLSLEANLRQAIERGELVVYYQPQYDVEQEIVSGMEALVRWKHPEKGLIYPSAFIPIAEESRFIVSLGEWILATACAQARVWHERFPFRLGVNLSPRQFQDRQIFRRIERALVRAGADPSTLEIEITESAAMVDTAWTATSFKRIRELGVSIAIDDFGTGHSSLGYLTRFEIDTLKIDRTFVHRIDSDARKAAIVAAIIAMARQLGLRVVAEGVETLSQLDVLREQGCSEMQGFYFSHAQPASEAGDLLAGRFTLPRTSA